MSGNALSKHAEADMHTLHLQIKAAFETIYKSYGVREEDIGAYGTNAATSSCPTKKSSAASVSPRLAVLGAIVGAAALFL
jgi:hypothetical protein